ncbi:MAG TPA: helix-turn-helix domain-containing protein [Pseudonocardiaceae bacterium]|jgi:predicted ArsR family transcriptional regulator
MTEARQPITDAKRLKALAHPLRWKLIKLIGSDETATATRCSEVLGESVASCSYHLNMLAKYGFVEEAEGGQGREKPWKLTSRRQSVDTDSLEGDAKLAAEAASEAFLETEFDEIRTQLRRGDLEPKEWQDIIGTIAATLWLTPDEAATLRQQFENMVEQYEERWDKAELRPEGARQTRLFLASFLNQRYPGH